MMKQIIMEYCKVDNSGDYERAVSSYYYRRSCL
jgi:hypothetical protein